MRDNMKLLLDVAMKYKTRFVALLLSFAALASSFALSLAWLSHFSKVTPDLSFTAGGPEKYVFYKITCANDSTVPDCEVESNLGMRGEDIDADNFFLNDLHFGSITNLAMLENSNFIYYAVKIPKVNGTRVCVGVNYNDVDGSHFKIYVPARVNNEITYDADGNIITTLYQNQAGLDGIKALETENETFVMYKVALSDIDPEEISSIDTLNGLFLDDALHLHNDSEGNPTQQILTYSSGESQSEYYYLYIKLEPNVSIYSGFIDFLWADMPFGLSYDVRFTLSVESEEPTEP